MLLSHQEPRLITHQDMLVFCMREIQMLPHICSFCSRLELDRTLDAATNLLQDVSVTTSLIANEKLVGPISERCQ